MSDTNSGMAQAFSAVRPAIFHQLVYDEPILGTHGGCLILFRLEGRVFVTIPKHCIGDFKPLDLLVTERQLDGRVGVKPFYVVTYDGIGDGAKGLDIEDIVIMTWREPVPLDFEGGIIDLTEIEPVQTREGDDLAIFGIPKDMQTVAGETAKIVYNFYDLVDRGFSHVPDLSFMRIGTGAYPDGPNEIIGFSGGLVWNRTQGAIAGLTLRGGKSNGEFAFHYVPIDTIKRQIVHARDLLWRQHHIA